MWIWYYLDVYDIEWTQSRLDCMVSLYVHVTYSLPLPISQRTNNKEI